MQLNLIYGIFILVFSLSNSSFGQKVDTLYAEIDMREPVKAGWFDPATEKVGLRGDLNPLNWGSTLIAQDPDSDGIYSLKIPFQIDEDSVLIAFKIKVDGRKNPNGGWQPGSNRQVIIRKGTKNILHIAWEEETEKIKSVITGNVKVIEDFESEELSDRDIYIYLPPGYEENNVEYPVIYMHDGQNIFDASAAGQEWSMDETAEKLIREGAIKPMIIVGISNSAQRIEEYTPTRQEWSHQLKRMEESVKEGIEDNYSGIYISGTGDTIKFKTEGKKLQVNIPGGDIWQELILQEKGKYFLPRAGITFEFFENGEKPVEKVHASKPSIGGKGDEYMRFLIHNVMPFIENEFRVRKGAEWTALGGSSLGGLITAYIGLKNPDKFGQLLIVSPSIWWDNRFILKEYEELEQPTNQRIWLYMGTNEGEGAIENAREFHDLLLKKGWTEEDLEYIESINAGHNERAWAKQVENMLRFIMLDPVEER